MEIEKELTKSDKITFATALFLSSKREVFGEEVNTPLLTYTFRRVKGVIFVCLLFCKLLF